MARLTRGRLKKVVRAYRLVLQGAPGDHGARLKVARALRLLHRNEEAIREYAELARLLSREGDLFGAISACKSILELDPRHEGTQLNIARLYAQAPRNDPATIPLMPIVRVESVSDDSVELSLDDVEIIDAEADSGEVIDTATLADGWDRIANRMAAETDEHLLRLSDAGSRSVPPEPPMAGGPEAEVPEIPLFSSLSRTSFIRLLERMERRRIAGGEALTLAGQTADALHVVSRGGLIVSRDNEEGREVSLGVIGPGEFVGEFAFLTGVPSPTTLSADGETEVLRLSHSVMRAVVVDHPEIETVLWRFFVDRMAHSLLATSALFRGLTAARQTEIGRHFEVIEASKGTSLVRPGEVAAGLYLLVSGGVDVLAGEGDHRVTGLGPGEFFGVRTAASGALPKARVVTNTNSILLVMPAAAFRQILRDEPSVRGAVDTVTGMRTLMTDALFQGRTSYADDGILKV